ncbi:MAG: CotH kinase family protein [Bacilli bacterium]|nr:CotH kinase family protein [Bacilli bacterium]MDY6430584.1 CotH kinase family protein [Bacilli bacterium]
MKRKNVLLLNFAALLLTSCSVSKGKVISSSNSQDSIETSASLSSEESKSSSLESTISSEISSKEESQSIEESQIIESEEESELLESSEETQSIETSEKISEGSELIESSEIVSPSEENSEVIESSEIIDSSEVSSSESLSSEQSSEKPPVEVALVSSEEYYELFDPSSKISMELYLSNEAMYTLSHYQGDPYDLKWKDLYLPGNFSITINGTTHTFKEVGVRMKGNTSRKEFVYNDQITDIVNFKISFKATFDDAEYLENPDFARFYKEWDNKDLKDERKDRNLFGLEKLDIKVAPRNDGNCFISEIYAYDSFRNNGLIAPRATLGSINLANDTSNMKGTMEIIEPIDKQMLKRYFSKADSKGDLYKCVYKGSDGKADLTRNNAVSKEVDSNGYNIGTRVARGKIGVEDPFNYYIPSYQLKTNDKKGEDSDFSNMVNYINAVWSTSYAGAPLSMLDSILDIDEFIKFSAISYLLGGFDDQRYNYNNYYLYFVPSSKKAIYIPYDWDWCMGDYFGFNLSDKTPFDEYTIDGNFPAAVYYSTFFKSSNNGNISYSRVEMQNQYMDDINSTIDNILNINSFKELNKFYTGSYNSEEVSRVSSYMNSKRIAASK